MPVLEQPVTEPADIILLDIARIAIALDDLWSSEAPTEAQVDALRIELHGKVVDYRGAGGQ